MIKTAVRAFICASIGLASLCARQVAQDGFNVRAFGATGNGRTLDSPPINKAIDACAQSGGGTVYFPAGTSEDRSSPMSTSMLRQRTFGLR